MLKLISLGLILLANSYVALADTTTVFLVRHAEKDTSVEQDQPLTPLGQSRAKQLTKILQHQPLAAVYSTDTRRTRDTAAPLVQANNLELKIYDVGELNANSIVQAHAGESIAIVGHSNTIPKLVNQLVNTDRYRDLEETEYDSLFIVNLDKENTNSLRLHIPVAE